MHGKMKPDFRKNDVGDGRAERVGGTDGQEGKTQLPENAIQSVQKFDGLNTQDRPPSTKLNLPSGELPLTFHFSSVYFGYHFQFKECPKGIKF